MSSGAAARGRRGIKRRRRKIQASPKPEDLQLITGRWKVVEVVYEPDERHSDSTVSGDDDNEDSTVSDSGSSGFVDIAGQFKGVELVLDDQCEVVWCLPRGVDPIPLFLTSTFAVDKDEIGFIGGPDGKTFTFEVEGDHDFLQLSSDSKDLDGTLTIRITRVKGSEEASTHQFSLEDALDEGFFSDLDVRSLDGQRFHVHRTVLTCCCPGMRYRDWEVFLSQIKSNLVSAVLSYIYTDYLPSGLTVPLAKELLAVTSANLKLSRLTDLCNAFIENHTLKQRLIQLVDDLQTCLEVVRKIVESTEVSNPVKVAYAVKQVAREAAVGATKFGLLCELYTRNKKEMSKPERQEALDYLRGRVVVFIDQLRELLELVLSKWNTLTDDQKAEVAQHIIPEVEYVWDLILSTSKNIHSSMEKRKGSLIPKKTFGRLERRDLKLALALQFMTRGKELRRLEKIGKEFEEFVEVAERKRQEFRDWSEDEKVARIMRAIHQLELEGQNQVEQLEDTKKEILIENLLEWKKFKFLIALVCSYVSWGVSRVRALKDPLKPVLLKACKFIQRKEVVEALVYFEMMEDGEGVPVGGRAEAARLPTAGGPGLCPPSLLDSKLAHGCRQLLDSHEHSDMQFVLMPQRSEGGEGDEGGGVVIPAHRVVVAARCKWFRRALLSGMKEAIDKCIVVHDVDEAVFRTFLLFLYGEPLDTPTLPTEELIELMAIADRYEAAELRKSCEGVLVLRVKDANVFLLLEVADRYSARKLREATLQHILQTPEVIVTEVEGWSGLSEDLKQELRTLLAATATAVNPSLLLRHRHDDHSYMRCQEGTLRERELECSSNSSDSSGSGGPGEVPYSSDPVPDALAFNAALVELRGFVGEEASDDLLRDLLLAADMDINRAVNFYLNTQGT